MYTVYGNHYTLYNLLSATDDIQAILRGWSEIWSVTETELYTYGEYHLPYTSMWSQPLATWGTLKIKAYVHILIFYILCLQLYELYSVCQYGFYKQSRVVCWHSLYTNMTIILSSLLLECGRDYMYFVQKQYFSLNFRCSYNKACTWRIEESIVPGDHYRPLIAYNIDSR